MFFEDHRHNCEQGVGYGGMGVKIKYNGADK